MTYRLLSIAHEELAEAFEYYEGQSSGLGGEFLDEFDAVMSRILQFPDGWRRIGQRHRRCMFRRFPYAVVYSPTASEIIVTGVMHLHRDPMRFEERMRGT